MKVCIKRQKPKEIKGHIEQCRKDILFLICRELNRHMVPDPQIPEAPADRDPEGHERHGPAFLNDLLPWSENLPDETIYLDFSTFFSFVHSALRGSALYSCFLATVVI